MIVLDVVAHFANVEDEGVEGLSESLLVSFVFEFEELYELGVDIFGVIFGLGHGLEVVVLVGLVELEYVLLHFLFVELPLLVYVHLNYKSDEYSSAHL